MRAIVTGATGFVGGKLLAQIDEPVVLSRNPEKARASLKHSTGRDIEVFGWDPAAAPPSPAAFRGVEAIFHLAGESVGEGRWTAKKKWRIRESRVAGTQHLVAALKTLDKRPPVLVSASAVGFYGSRGVQVLDETTSPGNDFLSEVCQAWEAASQAAKPLGVRVVNPRLGVVLGDGGGALAKMLLPFKLGAGGRLGNGNQWMPWVHVDDVVGLMLHAVKHAEIEGPINAVSPNPVTNREFTRILAAALHRPAIFPAPAFGLKLLLGEFADVLLGSQRVVPRVAERTGYTFHFADLAAALQAILHETKGAEGKTPLAQGQHA
jgi:uncharacterized protein (TIGR01777 family)